MYCFSQGVPAETFEAVAAAALPAIPTWKLHKLGRKEPNAYCSKYKASEEFLHVQLLRQGVPAETFEAVVTSALPTWKPPNYEKNILIQTTQCTKLQKSSYMYRFFSFLHLGVPTVSFSSRQRNLIKTFQIKGMIALITKMHLVFSWDLLNGQK